MELKIYYKCRNNELHSLQASNQLSIEEAFADAEVYLSESNVVWDKPMLGLLSGGKG